MTLALFFASCSSVYKSGQTPDDVYFSPERPHNENEYARVEKENDRMYNSQYNNETLEDSYLRMKIRNRRYAFLDDADYYAYGSNYYGYNNYYRVNNIYLGSNWWMWSKGYGSYGYNPYYYNPYYSNPYYSGVVYGNVSPVYNKPRTGNLNVYNPNQNSYNNYSKGRVFSTNGSSNTDSYRGSGNNAGGFLRNVFGSGNNNSNTTSTPAPSTSTPSSSSSSSSSGGGHAGVRKF